MLYPDHRNAPCPPPEDNRAQEVGIRSRENCFFATHKKQINFGCAGMGQSLCQKNVARIAKSRRVYLVSKKR